MGLMDVAFLPTHASFNITFFKIVVEVNDHIHHMFKTVADS